MSDKITPFPTETSSHHEIDTVPRSIVSNYLGKAAMEDLIEKTDQVSLRGPDAKDAEDIINEEAILKAVTDKVGDDETNILEVTRQVVRRYNKLLSRTGDKTLKLGTGEGLVNNILGVVEAVDITEDSTKEEIDATVLLAYYHGARTAQDFMSRKTLDGSLQSVEDEVTRNTIDSYLSRSQLIHFARYYAKDPVKALDRFVHEGERLISEIDDIVSEVTTDSELRSKHRFTPKQLLKLLRGTPTKPDEAVARVVTLFEELKKDGLPEGAAWKIAFEAHKSTDNARNVYDKAKELFETITKPENISDSSWWALLASADGKPETLDKRLQDYYLMRSSYHDINNSPRDTKRADRLYPRILALEEQGVKAREFLTVAKHGLDFSNMVLQILENYPGDGAEIIGAIQEYETAATNFSELFPADIQTSVSTALEERLTEVLTVAQEMAARSGRIESKIMNRFEVTLDDIDDLRAKISVIGATMQNAVKIFSDSTSEICAQTEDFNMYRITPQDSTLPHALMYVRHRPGKSYDPKFEHGTKGIGKGASIDLLIGTKPGKPLSPEIATHDGDGVISIRIDRDGYSPDTPRSKQRKNALRDRGQATLDFGSILGIPGTLGPEIGKTIALGNWLRAQQTRSESSLNHNFEPFDHEKYGTIEGFAELAYKTEEKLVGTVAPEQRAA